MKNFTKNFTNTIMSLSEIKFLWELFENSYMSSDPGKAFICANHAEFGKDIQNFSPALTPFADYTCWIDKITVSEKSVIAHIGKMLVGSDKISFGPFISYINGKKKIIREKEYFRLVLIHVLADPFSKNRSPYKIIKHVSEPRPFNPRKSYRFTFPLNDKNRYDFISYRTIRSFALCYNFSYEKETDKNGNPVLVECLFSCSETQPFLARLS